MVNDFHCHRDGCKLVCCEEGARGERKEGTGPGASRDLSDPNG